MCIAYVGSHTHHLATAGYSPTFKGKMLGQKICLYLKRCMQRLHPLSCDRSEMCTSTHVQKITNRNCGNSFLENMFIVIGKTLTDKGISKTYYIPVQRMAGTGYVGWGLPFFSCQLIIFELARVQGYLRKKEGSLPVKSNYVVKTQSLWTLT